MENEVRADTKGKIEEIDAKYELLKRAEYDRLANPLNLRTDKKQPLELYSSWTVHNRLILWKVYDQATSLQVAGLQKPPFRRVSG
jgi:hypothetical protein